MPLPFAEHTARLADQLEKIRKEMLAHEQQAVAWLKPIHVRHRAGARNLLHYLSLRTRDLRTIQRGLTAVGLSAFRQAEAFALSNLESVLFWLHRFGNPAHERRLTFTQLADSDKGKQLLQTNATRLLGKARHRLTRIMVTMPTEAATDADLVRDLLQNGMEVARINASHDTPDVWRNMVRHIRQAEQSTGLSCRILMDLAGPKLRTVVPGRKARISVRPGDTVLLVRPEAAGKATKAYKRVGVSLPEILADLREGHAVWFDDGKIGGVVRKAGPELAEIEIIAADADGSKLKTEKGINLPDTRLHLPSLTDDDLQQIPFVIEYADMIGYSFVRTVEDVYRMQDMLHQHHATDKGLILKIETRQAFDNLPALLLALMRSPNVGVMVARGDLAVEIGFERIAEVQEEILSLCEAAHLPDIWATQVLETQAKKGRATRAEVTDAAKSIQAECVMLNKGPHIVETVRTLHDILHRMSRHQDKKRRTYDALNVARRFYAFNSKS
jgi:pyruvate kinase